MTGYRLLQMGEKARRELRALRSARSRVSSNFSQGGIAKSSPRPSAAITLRRADYDRQKDRE